MGMANVPVYRTPWLIRRRPDGHWAAWHLGDLQMVSSHWSTVAWFVTRDPAHRPYGWWAQNTSSGFPTIGRRP